MLKDLFDHYRLQMGLGTLGLLLLSFSATTIIADPAYASECASVETTIVSCDSQTSGDNQTSGIWSLLLIVINILTAGVGVMAVGGFVYAAILWTTAEDKADQLNKAKNIILNTCVGLVSFGLMYSLLQFMVPGGVFNSITAPKVSISKQNDTNPGQTDTSSGPNNTTNGSPGAQASTTPPTSTEKCYVIGRGKDGDHIEGRYFHKSGSQTYAFENSPQGIRYAARHGYDSIDIDTQITKDGIIVGTHWSQPMRMDGFYDPNHQLDRDRKVSSMTLAEVTRLRNHDGQSRIYALTDLIKELANNKLGISLEIKEPRRFAKRLSRVVTYLNTYKIMAIIKGDAHHAGMDEALTEARSYGFWTRGTQGSQGWKAPNCRR